ncbi:DUF6882 domain-containing protein [Dyella japonica]|uniref:Uncharacterized protein n=1 Tax=Dyella japonica A8 TaxID=1217721 RepID=A0A075K199_9GAMM|nr:DUF6882 domain-containing protein [Dyella japonica]AIF46043.1 hypothetical protein HY57_01560 [Dyella japonica A8]
MTDEEFDVFLAKANDELRAKQAQLSHAYDLGEMKRWWFEQEGARLQFFDRDDKLAVEAEVIGIGSFSPKSSSWKWAWSNPTFIAPLREKALPLKQLQAVTGFDLFGKESAFSIGGEAMAWDLAAMAVQQLKALGCYRAPASSPDGPHTYLAITGIRPLTPPH